MIAFCVAMLLATFVQIGGPDLDAARRAYEAGRFEEALVRYEAALDDPTIARGAVLFNMGNCAYRLERFADAVWLYRRAELRLPGDREVAFNRGLAERLLGIDAAGQASPREPEGGPLLAAVFAAMQGAGLWLVLGRRRRILWGAVAIAIGLIGGVATVRAAWESRPVLAVAREDEIEVRREPHADLPSILDLDAGETVQVEERSDRWMRVSHPRGSGWTARAGFGIVD